MISAMIVAVYALAVARVTRLINADRLTERPRLLLAGKLWGRYRRRAGIPEDVWNDELDPPLSVYLLTCPWCVSVYVGAVAAPLAYWWGDRPWLLVPALALAFSHITGLLAKNGE